MSVIEMEGVEAKYGWVITRDYLFEQGIGDKTRVGVSGPYGCEMSNEDIKKNGRRFRMRDDDEELYYEGYIAGTYEGFEPLDDFGLPDSGCTGIEYLENGVWTYL